MRRWITAYSLVCLLLGLFYGPLHHLHEAGDSSHEHDDHHDDGEGAELHAHFFLEPPHLEQPGPAIELPHQGHHGTGMSVFVGSDPAQPPWLPEFEETTAVVEELPLTGYVLAPPVRTHDPPDRRNSNPRSPPA